MQFSTENARSTITALLLPVVVFHFGEGLLWMDFPLLLLWMPKKSPKPKIYMSFYKPKIYVIAGRKFLPAHHSHLFQVWSTLANYPEKCCTPLQNKEWQCREKKDTKNFLIAWFWGLSTHFSTQKYKPKRDYHRKEWHHSQIEWHILGGAAQISKTGQAETSQGTNQIHWPWWSELQRHSFLAGGGREGDEFTTSKGDTTTTLRKTVLRAQMKNEQLPHQHIQHTHI